MTATAVRSTSGTDRGLRLAARAANLAERTAVIERLERDGCLGMLESAPGPDAFESWWTERTSTRIAAKFAQEALHRNHPPRRDSEGITRVLDLYRRFEARTADAPVAHLEEVHQSWLPTYRAALSGYRPPARPRYQRLAIVAAPFLDLLERELRDAVTGTTLDFADEVVETLRDTLLDRFELPLAWAMETEAKVCLSRHGENPPDYLDFLRDTFRDEEAYHEFYLRYPVLGRWLARATHLAARNGRDLLTRLDADRPVLATLTGPIRQVRAVRPGQSDHHAGARTVVMVDLLTDSGPSSIVYKPRDISAEAAVQELLTRLAAEAGTGSAGRRVILRPGYGYEEMVPGGRNHARDEHEVRQVYRDLGAHLAAFYVLGGGDLHLENIIVADGHAHVCDCETVLGVLPTGQHRPEGTLLDSVFKTALLEWPTAGQPAEGTMRISGYAGGEAYDMPVPVARITGRALSFETAVTHEAGIRVEPDAANRVFLDGELVRPEDHVDDILEGFGQVYDWFGAEPARTQGIVRDLFRDAPIRFINWGTQIYTQLIAQARHPRCLIDPLEVDWLFGTVRTFPRTWDTGGVLADRELASMWQLDVPIFTARGDAHALVHDHAEPLDSPLDVSPVEFAARRIARLDHHNREQQRRYITASLSAAEISNPAFVDTCTDYAARIGEHLLEQMRTDGAPWASWDIAGPDGLSKVDVDGDLYHGSAGMAFFLAHLDAARPDPRFRAAARRGLEHALRTTDLNQPGAFQGIGGLMYTLNHLGRLWDDEHLTRTALELGNRLEPLIERDRRFDILGGCAGLVPVLLGLGQHDLARRCGERLLDAAIPGDGGVLSWPLTDPDEASASLTGFSHGAGGMGWALILLGRTLGEERWIAAGKQAFAYEATRYDGDEQDWYDLRRSGGGLEKNGRHYANAWCNGAAGIGLSRISAWDLLGRDDEPLLREAHQGLAATMRNFPQLRNDTLCHGRSGNAELLLRFALLNDEPAFQLEANVQVQSQWRNVDEALAGTSEGTAGFFPGLMLGLSGFGMHFLRLARPGQVPSVLLLDSPGTDNR